MKENKRFRNHISIVFEQVGSGFYVLLGFFLWQFIGDEEMVQDVANSGKTGMLIAAVAVFALLAIIFAVQLIIWSKTYISIQGNTIVLEKNTLRREKRTIGIKNISNVNTEQNLFERLVGTCAVKMDTNSLSTADSTDMKIVLKKADAEAFRDAVLLLLHGEEVLASEEAQSVFEGASWRELLVHGLFSIRFTSVLMAGCGFFGLVGLAVDALDEGLAGLLTILSELLLLGIVAVSGLLGIVKSFLKYHGFFVYRSKDRLYIRYGLLKKVNYTIPVDKINAIRLIQTPQARLFGRYSAELINVGMGDEKDNEQSFFLMYDKKAMIKDRLRTLLPEFASCMESQMDRQPPSVWKAWAVPFAVCLAVFAAGIAVVAELWKEAFLWVLFGEIGVLVLSLVLLGMRYRTEGTCLEEDFFGICKGAFGRTGTYIRYEKIQYVELKQNFLAKASGIAKGDVHMLASVVNQDQPIPYLREEKAGQLKEKLLLAGETGKKVKEE